jgi:hypothetical protein
MPTEVKSPINRKSTGPGMPVSPGARSNPSRGDGTGKPEPMPPQAEVHASLGGGEQPAEFHITGPSDE